MNRALVVDDAACVRILIRQALVRTGVFEVQAECATGEEAERVYVSSPPDLTILDAHLPGTHGFSQLKRLLSLDPQPLVVLLGDFDNLGLAAQAVREGAAAYVPKSAGLSSLVKAIMGLLPAMQVSQSQTRPAPAGVAVVDPDRVARRLVERSLAGTGLPTQVSVGTLAEARSAFEAGIPALLISEREFPDGDGLRWLGDLASEQMMPPTILHCGLADHQSVLTAARLGVGAFLRKPASASAIVSAASRLLAGPVTT